MNYVFARVVGNELPPRDSDNSKYRSLIHILENEIPDGFDRVWVLNRIHDADYRQLLVDALAGETVLEIPFSLREYAACQGYHERMAYATNLNPARNFALEYCRPKYRFTVSLDQDCYFWPSEWAKVRHIVENSDKKYFITPSKRVHWSKLPETLEGLLEEEPMIIFRNDTTDLFDPSYPYGYMPKVELLNRLGVWSDAAGAMIRTDKVGNAGIVCHIAYSDPLSEVDRHRRHHMRTLSKKAVVEKLDRRLRTF